MAAVHYVAPFAAQQLTASRGPRYSCSRPRKKNATQPGREAGCAHQNYYFSAATASRGRCAARARRSAGASPSKCTARRPSASAAAQLVAESSTKMASPGRPASPSASSAPVYLARSERGRRRRVSNNAASGRAWRVAHVRARQRPTGVRGAPERRRNDRTDARIVRGTMLRTREWVAQQPTRGVYGTGCHARTWVAQQQMRGVCGRRCHARESGSRNDRRAPSTGDGARHASASRKKKMRAVCLREMVPRTRVSRATTDARRKQHGARRTRAGRTTTDGTGCHAREWVGLADARLEPRRGEARGPRAAHAAPSRGRRQRADNTR